MQPVEGLGGNEGDDAGLGLRTAQFGENIRIEQPAPWATGAGRSPLAGPQGTF
jgi:hypothetical protein